MSLWDKFKGAANPCGEVALDKAQVDAVNEMAKAIEQDMYGAAANSWVTKSSLSSSRFGHMFPAGTNVVHTNDPSLIPSTAVPLSGGLAGLAGVTGNIYVDSNTGTIYTTGTQLDIQDLSPEEKEQLKNMEEDRKKETKRMKLDIFKKLPASLRQQVVDQFVWNDAVQRMNETTAPKSKEQEELENRDRMHNMYRGFLGGGYTSGGLRHGGMMDYEAIKDYMYGGARYLMPKDVTAEELMKAHAEATVEEEFTNTESK